MTVTIRLSRAFREYSGQLERVDVQGATVRECLVDLIRRFPNFEGLLFDSQNMLSVVVVSGGRVVSPGEIDRPVAEHQELSILPMLCGG